VTVLMLFRKIL